MPEDLAALATRTGQVQGTRTPLNRDDALAALPKLRRPDLLVQCTGSDRLAFNPLLPRALKYSFLAVEGAPRRLNFELGRMRRHDRTPPVPLKDAYIRPMIRGSDAAKLPLVTGRNGSNVLIHGTAATGCVCR